MKLVKMYSDYLNEKNESKIYTFEDLVFAPHIDPNLQRAYIIFDNGYSMSIVNFKNYSYINFNGEENFEICAFDRNNNFVYDYEVIGNLTKEEVTEEMLKIQNMKPPLTIISESDPYGEEDWNN